MCRHIECPYKYCLYHNDYDPELEKTLNFVIPDNEDEVEHCISYLDS